MTGTEADMSNWGIGQRPRSKLTLLLDKGTPSTLAPITRGTGKTSYPHIEK